MPLIQLFLLPLLLVAGVARPLLAQDDQLFEMRVRPLLVENCYACHTEERMGGLQLDTRDHAMKGGLCGRYSLIDNRVLRLLYILLQTLPKIGVSRWRAKPRQIRGQFRSSSLDLELKTANVCVAQFGPPFRLESR